MTEEYIDLDIVDMGHGGVGVARDERVVFVRGAIPGEKVRAKIVQKRSKLWRAVVTEVLEPSEHRVTHPWPEGAAGNIGAADFGHIALDYQRELKGQVLNGTIRRIGGEELSDSLGTVEVLGVDDGDGWHTRTRFDCVKLPTGVGMYREQSHDVVPITDMPLAVEDLADLDLFGDAWDEHIKPGTRIHVVSPASGENLAVTNKPYTAPGTLGPELIEEHAASENNLYNYFLAPAGFWQVHFRAPNVLLELVLAGAAVEPGMKVAELFAGAGLFSVPLARQVGEKGKVITLEGGKEAVNNARQNLVHYPWAEAYRRGIDAETIREVIEGMDVVIADPPRRGLGEAAAREIATSAAERIVLVSCDPAAMARDVAELVHNGREVVSVQARDIFPHTHHMEVVTVVR